MLYKVLSPDNLYDQNSNDSAIDDSFQQKNVSPLPRQVHNYASSQLSPSSLPSSGNANHYTAVGIKTEIDETETPMGSESQELLDSVRRKQYLGVRVRQPVRDLLRAYRNGKGENPSKTQREMFPKPWKQSQVRKRASKESLKSHPYTIKRRSRVKESSQLLQKNFEEIMQDLVEILETDLKQARNHSFPTPLSPADRRPQDGIYSDRPLCLSSPLGQSDQGTLHSSLPEEHGRTRQGAPSSCESDSGQVSPVQSPGFGGEGYWSESDEDSFGQLAIPWDSAGSPSSSTTSSYSSSSSLLSPDENPPGFHVAFSECYKSYSPAAGSTKAASCSPQQGDLVESSGMTFFQFQLQQEESFLSNMSIHEILIPDTNGNTMLHKAVIQCKRALAYCLARKMASVGEIGVKDIRGQTALHLAAERNQHLMVGDFLSLGAQINERDCLGKTSVHLCAENGFLRVLEVIEDALMNGTVVDIEAADNNYLTPLHCAVLAHSAIVKDSECSKGNRDLDKFLRMRKEQLLDGMRCLLRMGASFLKQDMNGRNAIQFAQEENNREVLCFLQTQAESARITLRQDWRSYTPLDLMSKKVNGLKGQAPSRHYPN